ncbi:MAG: ATP-binding protein, partial [Candidatus Binatia bacterium]
YLTFLVIGSLGLIGWSWVISRTIVSPIRTLAAATQEVAGGHLEKRVLVSSKDEIGQLSYSFNVMAERLAKHERQLRSLNERLERKVREAEALYKIGTEIMALSDIDKILHSVVVKAKELLGCEVGALCLVDEEGRELIPRVTSGPPDAFVQGGRQGVEEGVAADVMGLCPPDKAEAGLERQVLRCGVVRPEYLEAHLAIALKRGEKMIGAFCVGGRRFGAFSAAEVDLLSGLATQAAIAIEKARLYEKTQSLAILEERERIAHEMHDGLAQALGTLHLQISRAQELPKGDEPARMRAALEEIRRMAEGAYEDVRQAIFGLRTMDSRSLGLVPTLKEYLHGWSFQNGVAVDLEIRDERATRLSPEAELQLMRIIQEALTNVRKHAAARCVQVWLELEGDHVLITVADDGRGFDLGELPGRARKCFGLETMRERAKSLGGSLEVHSRPGRGTSVLVRLPLPAERRS